MSKSDKRLHAKKKSKRINNKNIVEDLARTLSESAREPIPTDVTGSYTGVPDDKTEPPVQDADDL